MKDEREGRYPGRTRRVASHRKVPRDGLLEPKAVETSEERRSELREKGGRGSETREARTNRGLKSQGNEGRKLVSLGRIASAKREDTHSIEHELGSRHRIDPRKNDLRSREGGEEVSFEFQFSVLVLALSSTENSP